MDDQPASQEFRPIPPLRRGELIAWLSTALIAGAWLLTFLIQTRVNLLLTLAVGLMGFIASAISLGNWIDRKTRIVISQPGIHFQNGLRNIFFPWQEICEVRVLPAIWGKKVQVFAKDAYFGFTTGGEVQAYGKIVTQTGFVQGDQIVKQILERSNLNHIRTLDTGLGIPGYSYTRE